MRKRIFSAGFLAALFLCLPIQTQGSWKAWLEHEIASRYIFFEVDFLPDDYAISIFRLKLEKGGFDSKTYFAHDVSGEQDYIEMGADISYKLLLFNKKFGVKGVLFPFWWKHFGKEYWGAMFGCELVLESPLETTLGAFRLHVPDIPESEGNYYMLKFKGDLLGFGLENVFAYNGGFFSEESGITGMLKISREFRPFRGVLSVLSVKPFFSFHWSLDREVNENEPVFGLVTNFEF
jgi:hypothetical protein